MTISPHPASLPSPSFELRPSAEELHIAAQRLQFIDDALQSLDDETQFLQTNLDRHRATVASLQSRKTIFKPKKSRELQKQVEFLQGEMEAAENRLSLLRAESATILEKRNEYASVFTPVRYLPDDVLVEIMLLVVTPSTSTDLTSTYRHWQDSSTDRWIFKGLRSVCRHWRRVAFASPLLWSTVWIDFDQYDHADHPQLIQSIRNYFNHAGPTAPLKIGFSWQKVFQPPPPDPRKGTPVVEDPDTFTLWMDFLFAWRSRWEEIAFFSLPSFFQIFQARLKSAAVSGLGNWRASYLEVATVNLHNWPETPFIGGEGDKTCTLESCFPRLRTAALSLEGDILHAANEHGMVSLLDRHLSLRTLRLDIYQDANPFFASVRNFRNLTTLLIFFQDPLGVIPDRNPGGSPATLPHLKDMSVHNLHNFTLFSHIRAPALSTLRIYTTIPRTKSLSTLTVAQNMLWRSFDQLTTFVEATGDNLRALHINCWFLMGDEALRQLLQPCAFLESLCIDTWFSSRMDGSNRAPLLHQLQRFCLHPADVWTNKVLDLAPSDHQAFDSDADEWDPRIPFARSGHSWVALRDWLESLAETGGSADGKLVISIPVSELQGGDCQDEAQHLVEAMSRYPSVVLERTPRCNGSRLDRLMR